MKIGGFEFLTWCKFKVWSCQTLASGCKFEYHVLTFLFWKKFKAPDIRESEGVIFFNILTWNYKYN